MLKRNACLFGPSITSPALLLEVLTEGRAEHANASFLIKTFLLVFFRKIANNYPLIINESYIFAI